MCLDSLVFLLYPLNIATSNQLYAAENWKTTNTIYSWMWLIWMAAHQTDFIDSKQYIKYANRSLALIFSVAFLMIWFARFGSTPSSFELKSLSIMCVCLHHTCVGHYSFRLVSILYLKRTIANASFRLTWLSYNYTANLFIN